MTALGVVGVLYCCDGGMEAMLWEGRWAVVEEGTEDKVDAIEFSEAKAWKFAVVVVVVVVDGAMLA